MAKNLDAKPGEHSVENTEEPEHHSVPAPADLPTYVVGIGASAGGLEALESMFAQMPLRTGMAFVIIQHLSPDYKSMMDELLARKTMIPVRVAQDQMPIEADTIYLLPPNKEMIAANGNVYLTERESTDGVNLPINTFFRSLAETYQEKSVAIVLSGTGSDGSKGVPLVHDSGGFVMVQTPSTCKFSFMPDNAIQTNNVDLVVDPENMPDALIKYSQRTIKVEQQMVMRECDPEVGQFSEILLLLNNRFNLDFAQYKPSTISRRLERRLALQRTRSLRDYIDVLLSNSDELEALYFDLLIGVTQFFRDRNAFASLQNILPKLLDTFKGEAEIRVWVAACATGQEAYSTAIVIAETMRNNKALLKPFKIFATDVHSRSIQFAAAGIYAEDDLADMDAEIRERYFKQTPSGSYQVSPEIRKSIVFAQHNLLKDPPFTRTHLVQCRNLLIYLNAPAQQRVLSLLTFSLMNQGLLLLGSSEAIGNHGSEFVTVDATHRIFRKNRDSQLRLEVPMAVRHRGTGGISGAPVVPEERSMNSRSRKALDVLLQEHVPASVLIDQKGEIQHVFGDAGNFLSMTFGTPSNNIRNMVSGQAKTVLTQMIYHLGKKQRPLKSRGVEGFTHYDAVDVEMRLLSNAPNDLDYYIVSFSETVSDEAATEPKSDDEPVVVMPPGMADDRLKELEDELQFTQESLQSTVEELETSNEELQASNEELMASNEELQSTNEELQSVNEELYTVNAEFQRNEAERSELAANERVIIDESSIGIVFLDANLSVRKVSPIAAKLFGLHNSSERVPLNTMTGQLIDGIRPDIMSVFKTGRLIEHEIEHERVAYLMRISPSVRDAEEEPSSAGQSLESRGVVITFTDISEISSAATCGGTGAAALQRHAGCGVRRLF